MENFDKRLQEMGITLPDLPAPIANYVPAKRVGNLIFTAGQVSIQDGYAYKGKLGADVSAEEARAATKDCAINCLAAIKNLTGSLNHVKQVVAVHDLVNSAPDSEDQAKAMNGASDFTVKVFGEAGKHTRTAVGVASLPMGFVGPVYLIVDVEWGRRQAAGANFISAPTRGGKIAATAASLSLTNGVPRRNAVRGRGAGFVAPAVV